MTIPCAILAMAHDREDVQAVIDSAFLLAKHQLRRGRAPHIYASGVRYKREEHATLPGVERVQTPEEVVAMGFGDCDDLAPYLAASRVVLDGIPCEPVVIESPGIGYHVVVEYPDGSIECPSARLGMLSPAIGEESTQDKRKRKAAAMLRRSRELARQAEKYNPYSAAAKTLLDESKLMRERAMREHERAEDED